MSTYTPFGLSYLLPAAGSITLTSSDFYSASGAIGPVTVKLTNISTSATSVISYGNPYIPPIVYPALEYDVAGQVIHITSVTIQPSTSAICDISNGSSTPNWNVGETFTVYGAAIGGTSPTNDLTFTVTQTDPVGSTGRAVAATYTSGLIPGPEIANPTLPTSGNPSQVIIVSPGQTEYVQIPGSIVAPEYNPLILYASGADVYVTPVLLVV